MSKAGHDKSKPAIPFYKMVLGVIFISSAMMWLSSGGSFNPLHPGFYLSIATGIGTVCVTVFLLNRYRVQK